MKDCGDPTVPKYPSSRFIPQIGFHEKLFKEVSWLSNFKYYCIHLLPEQAYHSPSLNGLVLSIRSTANGVAIQTSHF